MPINWDYECNDNGCKNPCKNLYEKKMNSLVNSMEVFREHLYPSKQTQYNKRSVLDLVVFLPYLVFIFPNDKPYITFTHSEP